MVRDILISDTTEGGDIDDGMGENMEAFSIRVFEVWSGPRA